MCVLFCGLEEILIGLRPALLVGLENLLALRPKRGKQF